MLRIEIVTEEGKVVRVVGVADPRVAIVEAFNALGGPQRMRLPSFEGDLPGEVEPGGGVNLRRVK